MKSNTQSYNVIGDIAGNYKTLMALIDKMPKGKIVAVGDLVDRGPRAPEVVSYFMNNQENAIALMGNHEHMMLDYCNSLDLMNTSTRSYDRGIWLMNGGNKTWNQYGQNVPKEVLKFLATRDLDLKLDIDGKTFYISHAFVPKVGDRSWDYDESDSETFKRLWNRKDPIFTPESADVQICGHNSQMGMKYFSGPNGKQAICIDTSASEVLTGIHLPTMKIYQQEYID